MNKKLKTFLSVGLAMTIIGTGEYKFVDGHIDHIHSYCPFNRLFGIEHQMKEVNNNPKYSEFKAVFVPEHITPVIDIIDATPSYNSRGDLIYSVPSGYTLSGTLGTKEKNEVMPDAVVIYDENDNIVNTIVKR